MFSIDEDELDIDLDDEEFLLAACGIVPPSSSSSNNTSSVTCNSENDMPIQSRAGSSRKPFNPLDNSATFSREKDIQVPGKYSNPSKPAGSGNINIFPPTRTNDDNNNSNQRCTLKTNSPRTGLQELEPQAKRFASNSINPSFSQKHNSNSNTQRISYNCNSANLNNISSKMDSRALQSPDTKDVNSPKSSNPQGLYRKNVQSCSPSMFCRNKASLNGSCLNPRTRSPGSDLRTPDISRHGQNNSMTLRGRQMDTNDNANTSCIDVTPSRKKSSRKFPGPAGLLPKLTTGQNLEDLSMKLSPLPSTSWQSPVNHNPVSSQLPSEDEEFSRDPWVGMYNEYQQNVPAMMRYSIVQVMSEAACQRLRYGKVPSLCVLVKTFSPTETDSSIFLKDPTGEIYGTLHKRVLEDYQTELGPGAGLILKQVSVFSPSLRKHYLNITPGNIIQINPPDPSHVNSSQLLASQGTQAANSQQRTKLEEPELILEPLSRTPDKPHQDREISLGNSENFDELLEGLSDDEILDEDLLAMY